jgi:DNA-3-methyladenine glycosylase I
MVTTHDHHRCAWCGTDPLYVRYHDEEWGVPLHDDRRLFEAIVLDGAQAGLSWITILRKRENYRVAYDGFNPAVVARYDDEKMAALLANAGIVRNRAKITASVSNARAFLKVQEEFGTFGAYLWRYVDGTPIQNRWRSLSEIPAETPLSQTISKDLLKRGFKFVGSTICYAMMQAIGMVNDHTLDCFRHDKVAAMGKALRLPDVDDGSTPEEIIESIQQGLLADEATPSDHGQ